MGGLQVNYEVLGEIFKDQLNKERKERCKDDDNYCKREKFLSRVFGIFSEEIVGIWCQHKKSPYKNLGRPSLYDGDGKYTRTTLDFTFQDKDNKVYIVEMKSEIQYENFKYFHLNNEDELKGFLSHHRKKQAFKRFEELGKNPDNYIVKYLDSKTNIKYKVEKIAGIILIWGKVNQDIEGRKNIGGFHQVLSVERMISDLITWNKDDGDKKFIEMIDIHQCWSNDMFDQLVGKPSKNDECRKQTKSCHSK